MIVWTRPGGDLVETTPEEMESLFRAADEAANNTALIAEKTLDPTSTVAGSTSRSLRWALERVTG